MRYILLILIAFSAFAGEGGDPPKLPADAAKVVADHDAAVAKAKEIYDLAVAKANDAGAKAMEAVVKAHTTKGDLDGAVAAKGAASKWKGEEGDILGQKKTEVAPEAKSLCGTWMVGGNAFKFASDGTWTTPWANLGGTWKPRGKQIVLVANKGNNGTYVVTLKDGESWSLNGSLGGTGGVLSKVSDE